MDSQTLWFHIKMFFMYSDKILHTYLLEPRESFNI